MCTYIHIHIPILPPHAPLPSSFPPVVFLAVLAGRLGAVPVAAREAAQALVAVALARQRAPVAAAGRRRRARGAPRSALARPRRAVAVAAGEAAQARVIFRLTVGVGAAIARHCRKILKMSQRPKSVLLTSVFRPLIDCCVTPTRGEVLRRSGGCGCGSWKGDLEESE